MTKVTITEALAELKTLESRIEKKQEFITSHLARQEQVKDPFAKDGGTEAVIRQEIQSLHDLLSLRIAIRSVISRANMETKVKIKNAEYSIAEWIVWKREVLPVKKAIYGKIAEAIKNVRQNTINRGFKVTTPDKAEATDVVINLDEKWLKEVAEETAEIEGQLDGQLSLKNATVVVEY